MTLMRGLILFCLLCVHYHSINSAICQPNQTNIKGCFLYTLCKEYDRAASRICVAVLHGTAITIPMQTVNRPTKSCQRYSFDFHRLFVHSFTPLWTRAWTNCAQTLLSAQKRNALMTESVPANASRCACCARWLLKEIAHRMPIPFWCRASLHSLT